jgi:hypothetical protein
VRTFELWDFEASVKGVDVAVVSGALSLGEAALRVVGREGAKMADMDFVLRKNGIFCEGIGIGDDDSMVEIWLDRSLVNEACDPPRSLPSLLTTVLRWSWSRRKAGPGVIIIAKNKQLLGVNSVYSSLREGLFNRW